MTSNESQLVKKNHPIRGILWGIPLGLGLAVVLIVTQIIPLDLTQIIVVSVLGIIAGGLWGMFGPAKKPKGAAPSASASDVPTPPAPMGPEPEGDIEAAIDPAADGVEDPAAETDGPGDPLVDGS